MDEFLGKTEVKLCQMKTKENHTRNNWNSRNKSIDGKR